MLTAAAGESWRLWLVGHPDQALQIARSAIAFARSQPNPLYLADALFFGAQVSVWRRELGEAERLLREGGNLATEYHFGFWIKLFTGLDGMIDVGRGEADAGIGKIRETLAEMRRVRIGLLGPALLAALAEAHLQRGQLSDGQRAADAGLQLLHSRLDQIHAAEVWRVKGELLTAGGRPWEEAEACFARGLEIAREQGAVAFALRAATGLARHLGAQGRRVEAQATLAPLYGRFSEGLNTADLREARAVLEDLAS
jgi:tetratricopeptide (TPR) repeat protein